MALCPIDAAKAPTPGTYDPHVTFAPLTLPEPNNAYRSSNGAPGPSSWQNEADYEMHARIDTTAKVLTNDETITYTNNSPDELTSLGIYLDKISIATIHELTILARRLAGISAAKPGALLVLPGQSVASTQAAAHSRGISIWITPATLSFLRPQPLYGMHHVSTFPGMTGQQTLRL